MPMTSYGDPGTSSGHTFAVSLQTMVTGGKELILLNAACKGESGTLPQPKGGFTTTQARPDDFHENHGMNQRFGNSGKRPKSVKRECF